MEDYNIVDIEKINQAKKFSIKLRSNILKMAYAAGSNSAHIGGALSIADILGFLFSNVINFEKKNPFWEDRDRFILSKGHACLAYYAALNIIGYIKDDELNTFEKNKSNLLGHPVINRDIGIEFSNGSLGMGLSLAIGVALSMQKRKKDSKVFVILGDGECNEGSIWEAAMSIPNLNLKNIFVIIDRNNFQQTGSNNSIMDLRNLKDKWSSFGWHTEEIDGHNLDNINSYFNNNISNKSPNVLIANTIKGKGFSFCENNNNWHHSMLSKSQYEIALKELDD